MWRIRGVAAVNFGFFASFKFNLHGFHLVLLNAGFSVKVVCHRVPATTQLKRVEKLFLKHRGVVQGM